MRCSKTQLKTSCHATFEDSAIKKCRYVVNNVDSGAEELGQWVTRTLVALAEDHSSLPMWLLTAILSFSSSTSGNLIWSLWVSGMYTVHTHTHTEANVHTQNNVKLFKIIVLILIVY